MSVYRTIGPLVYDKAHSTNVPEYFDENSVC